MDNRKIQATAMSMHTIYWVSDDKTKYHLVNTFKTEDEATRNLPREREELLRVATSEETRRLIEAGRFIVCEDGE